MKDDDHSFISGIGTGFILVAMWVLFALLSSAAHARNLTFRDGYEARWAEVRGPMFELAWWDDDVETVRRAFENLEELHFKYPDGITNYQMGRRQRILDGLKMPAVYQRFGMILDLDLIAVKEMREASAAEAAAWRIEKSVKRSTRPLWERLVTKWGTWRVETLSLPEWALTGFAVSRDKYCRPENQDTDDLLAAGAMCTFRNNAAMGLFPRIDETPTISDRRIVK